MRSSNLWNGVVGFWSATAGPSGYRLLDRSGRGNHGTLTNMDAATDWVVDGGRYALDFDGTNDYVLIQKSQSFDALIGDKTIQAWIKTSGAGASFRTVFSRDKTFSITLNNNVFGTFNWVASQFASSGVNVANSLWNHLVVQIRAGVSNGSQCFVNGLPRGSAFTYNTQVGNTTNDLTIGSALDGANSIVNEYVAGRFDDLILWARTLSSSEILQLYQIGRGGMLTPRRRRRAYSVATGLRRRLLLTGQV
jgi:hypothetical protein